MSESKGIRVTLGPVAVTLIEGVDSKKRPRVLDQAIEDLRAQASARVKIGGVDEQGTEISARIVDALSDVQTEVRTMRRAMLDMKEIALAEMRMTRLLVGTLVDQSNEDHVALMRFAGDMIQKMYDSSELLTQEDARDLERREDLFHRINRMELERGPEVEDRRDRDEEIAR